MKTMIYLFVIALMLVSCVNPSERDYRENREASFMPKEGREVISDGKIVKELSLRFGLSNSEQSILSKNKRLLHLVFQLSRNCGDTRGLIALQRCNPTTDDDALACITLNLLGLNIDKDEAYCVESAGLTLDIVKLLSGGASAEDVENAINVMKNSGDCDMTVFWNTFMGTNFTKEEIDCMLEADAQTDAIPTLTHRMHVLKGDDQKKRFINMICHPELMDPRDDWELEDNIGDTIRGEH